jgi:predicted GTPase
MLLYSLNIFFFFGFRLRERKESVTVLLCGTSGCGKSTLSALLVYFFTEIFICYTNTCVLDFTYFVVDMNVVN